MCLRGVVSSIAWGELAVAPLGEKPGDRPQPRSDDMKGPVVP